MWFVIPFLLHDGGFLKECVPFHGIVIVRDCLHVKKKQERNIRKRETCKGCNNQVEGSRMFWPCHAMSLNIQARLRVSFLAEKKTVLFGGETKPRLWCTDWSNGKMALNLLVYGKNISSQMPRSPLLLKKTKPWKKSGLEPYTAPTRLADPKHRTLWTQPNPIVFLCTTLSYPSQPFSFRFLSQ